MSAGHNYHQVIYDDECTGYNPVLVDCQYSTNIKPFYTHREIPTRSERRNYNRLMRKRNITKKDQLAIDKYRKDFNLK